MGIVEYVLAFALGVLAVARLTRLIYFDDFPPSVFIRRQWDRLTKTDPTTPTNIRVGWNKLMYCPYCLSFYVGLAWAIWALGSDFHWTWWAASAVLGGSYVAAIVVSSDWG